MLKKIAYFNTGSVDVNFVENEDGSISKRALVLAEGSWVDNRGRSHVFPAERIQRIAENSNESLANGIRVPVAKEHGKTIDDFVGDVNTEFVVKEITEDDLPNKKNKHLIGKLGIFCDDLVIRAKDTIEKVKNNLAKELSPGIDVMKDRIKEISIVGFPAIQGMSLFGENTGEMDGIYTLDDADAMSQDEEELKEEFEDLSYKFYCVIKNIMKNGEELGEEADVMVEKAFVDYEMRLRDLFGLTDEIPDEDESVADTQSNGYSLQQAPGMVQSDYAPYSLYDVDSADFAFGQQMLGNLAKGYRGGFDVVKNSVQDVFKQGAGMKAGRDRLRNYFTKVGAPVMKDGRMSMGASTMRWGRVGKAAGAVAGTGVAGYGAYRLGRAGLGAVGIGRKEDRRGIY